MSNPVMLVSSFFKTFTKILLCFSIVGRNSSRILKWNVGVNNFLLSCHFVPTFKKPKVMFIFRTPRTIIIDSVNFIKKKFGNLGIYDLIFHKKYSKRNFTHSKLH